MPSLLDKPQIFVPSHETMCYLDEYILPSDRGEQENTHKLLALILFTVHGTSAYHSVPASKSLSVSLSAKGLHLLEQRVRLSVLFCSWSFFQRKS